MPKVQFTNAQRVPVKDLWRNEANDFTPWLRQNMQLLAEELGIDLRFVAQEEPVGSFRVDLVAERDGFHLAVIENQLDKSNHTHLGQCLTYAAGLGAGTVIWIAADFDSEHVSAVRLLNQGMQDELHFFAVRLEAFRVAGSQPVPRFRVIAHPQNWFPPREGDLELRTRRGIGFFARLSEESGDETMGTGSNSGFEFMAGADSAGGDGVTYTLRFRGSDHTKGTSVHLWIETESRERNLEIFRRLQRQRAAIEREVGHSLRWEASPPGGNACAIRWHAGGSIDDSPIELAETRADMLARFEKLKAALDKRLPAAVSASG